jgi:hypothetical protein
MWSVVPALDGWRPCHRRPVPGVPLHTREKALVPTPCSLRACHSQGGVGPGGPLLLEAHESDNRDKIFKQSQRHRVRCCFHFVEAQPIASQQYAGAAPDYELTDQQVLHSHTDLSHLQPVGDGDKFDNIRKFVLNQRLATTQIRRNLLRADTNIFNRL